MENNKQYIYYNILKYFYSWYTVPMMLLHELCHICVASVLGVKILKFKIFKEKVIPIYNGVVVIAYNKKHWKNKIILYSPLLLLLPFVLMFYNIVFSYISLYFITTIMIYKKNIIFMGFPSKSDLKYLNNMSYVDYVVSNSSEMEYNEYVKNDDLKTLIKKHHLLNGVEFEYSKKNKNKPC